MIEGGLTNCFWRGNREISQHTINSEGAIINERKIFCQRIVAVVVADSNVICKVRSIDF